MSDLIYRTRGDTSPSRKARVYFTAHPGDFDAHFSTLSGDILRHQNCAVWRREAPEDVLQSDEEMALLLGQMQLIVVPVTRRMLEAGETAADAEIAFAERAHIPILPILMEPCSEALFAAKFGTRQYLDRCETDQTAIGYDEKLEKYLRRILVGDDELEKISAAFDARVFMSYRKKDRGHAQRAMRLIHAVPGFQRFAIWYDEFLVPGEQFDGGIRKALQKSDLFCLVVTPNLINEENYVCSVEYPLARAFNKPILPIEMAATDRDALSRKYDGLPPCLPGEAGPAFESGMREALSAIGVEAKADAPDRSYYVGLAYLNGVDVEVDFDRAVALITDAAERGRLEAMETLATMYHEGKGVPRDYAQSLDWRERAVALLRAEDGDLPFFYALCDLHDAYKELSMEAEVRDVCGELLSVSQRLGQAEDADHIYTQYTANAMAGAAAESAGDYDEAYAFYLKSNAVLTELAGRAHAFSAQAMIAGYNRLGALAQKQGDSQRAKECFNAAFELSRLLGESADDHRRELANGLFREGDIELREGDPFEALERYRKGYEITRQLFEEYKTQKAERDLSIAYEKLVDAERKLGMLKQAYAHLRLGLEICQRMYAQSHTLEDQMGVLAFHSKEAHLLDDLGRADEAETKYRFARDMASQTHRQYATLETREAFCTALADYAVFVYQRQQYPKAQELFLELLHCRRENMARTRTLATELETLRALRNALNASLRLGDTGTAASLLDQGFQLLEEMGKADTAAVRNERAILYVMRGELDLLQNSPDHAREMFQAFLEIVPGTAPDSQARLLVNPITSKLSELQAQAEPEALRDEAPRDEAPVDLAELRRRADEERETKKSGLFARLFRKKK